MRVHTTFAVAGLSISTISAASSSSLSTTTATSSASISSSPAEGLITSGDVSFGNWAAAYAKAKTFAESLNTTEKYALITGSGVDAVNFTALQFLDGQMGAQEYYYASAFSQAAALAMTWDKEAIYEQARAVASEFYQKGVQVINGPTSQPLGRTPWGGRLGETFGPDPYMNGIVFGLSVKGYSDVGVIAGGKHFLLNEQETNRTSGGSGTGGGMGGSMTGGAGGSSSGNSSSSDSASMPSGTMSSGGATGGAGGTFSSGTGTASVSASGTSSAPAESTGSSSNSSSTSSSSSSDDSPPYSSNADDKTLHETYLWPFYDGVKNGLGAVMCAMTEVNGTASCENSELLMDVLKTELGFPGMVYPDVNGQKTALGSIQGGLDYGSSSTWSTSTLAELLSNGSLTEARLNDMVIRNVIGWYQAGLNNGSQPSLATTDEYRDVRGNHSSLIRENGAKSIVLLKNNGVLPLNKPRSMAVFGANAGPGIVGPNMAFTVQGSGPTYDGHLATGSGSGQGSLPYLITPNTALTYKASQDGTMIRWLLNDTYSGESSTNTEVTVGNAETGITPSYAGYATNSEVCLVFINALSGEGADRTELYNADQDTMVKTVASSCNNTVVVVTTTGARLLDAWIENDNITAVLYSAPLGQESGNSIVDVLYGNVNPSARLTYTIAKNESDYNVDICGTKQCNFTEGVYLDYRSFIDRNVTARYAFGHGLSYTSFTYSKLKAAFTGGSGLSVYPSGKLSVGGYADLWDVVANVSVTIKNAGSLSGTDIPQLYIGYPSAADQPKYQLRGFESVSLGKGGSENVRFELRRRDLSYWDVSKQQWAMLKGTYNVYIGHSVANLTLSSPLVIS